MMTFPVILLPHRKPSVNLAALEGYSERIPMPPIEPID